MLRLPIESKVSDGQITVVINGGSIRQVIKNRGEAEVVLSNMANTYGNIGGIMGGVGAGMSGASYIPLCMGTFLIAGGIYLVVTGGPGSNDFPGETNPFSFFAFALIFMGSLMIAAGFCQRRALNGVLHGDTNVNNGPTLMESVEILRENIRDRSWRRAVIFKDVPYAHGMYMNNNMNNNMMRGGYGGFHPHRGYSNGSSMYGYDGHGSMGFSDGFGDGDGDGGD